MFAGNFERLARANLDFRQVIQTGSYSQVVAMSLTVGEDIGEEVHISTDQMFLVASGVGEALVGDEKRKVEEGDFVFVPAGTLHNVVNIGDEDLKLLTIYAPPEHLAGAVQKTKAAAEVVS